MTVAWDPTDPEFRADPYPTYRAMLAEQPFYRHELGFHLLCRYQDCLDVMRHPAASNDFRKSAHWAPPEGYDPQQSPMAFLFLDPPDHTRIRSLVSRAFTPSRVEQVRPLVETIVGSTLDRAEQEGSMEVLEELAFPLPVTIICDMLGVPADDRPARSPGGPSSLCRLGPAVHGHRARRGPDVLQGEHHIEGGGVPEGGAAHLRAAVPSREAGEQAV
ncbi:MAG TPA: hypothetical protein VME46_03780 [Acidimicrobiales bacterium]|nr:hypothetical protein [Acidimicrobiales bacterium]